MSQYVDLSLIAFMLSYACDIVRNYNMTATLHVHDLVLKSATASPTPSESGLLLGNRDATNRPYAFSSK